MEFAPLRQDLREEQQEVVDTEAELAENVEVCTFSWFFHLPSI